MEEVGLSDTHEPYLTKDLDVAQGQFLCIGWRRLFRIQEPVYKELCVKFRSNVRFRKKKGTYDRKNITFCLIGEQREMSLADFAFGTKLYLPSEVHTASYT